MRDVRVRKARRMWRKRWSWDICGEVGSMPRRGTDGEGRVATELVLARRAVNTD